MALNVVSEAKRCLNCKKPMCRQGCPISTNIPKMIELFLNNKMEEAARCCSRTTRCPWCVRLSATMKTSVRGIAFSGAKGPPVHISSIENYISSTYFDRLKLEQKPKNGKRVGIVGSVPQE